MHSAADQIKFAFPLLNYLTGRHNSPIAAGTNKSTNLELSDERNLRTNIHTHVNLSAVRGGAHKQQTTPELTGKHNNGGRRRGKEAKHRPPAVIHFWFIICTKNLHLHLAICTGLFPWHRLEALIALAL